MGEVSHELVRYITNKNQFVTLDLIMWTKLVMLTNWGTMICMEAMVHLWMIYWRNMGYRGFFFKWGIPKSRSRFPTKLAHPWSSMAWRILGLAHFRTPPDLPIKNDDSRVREVWQLASGSHPVGTGAPQDFMVLPDVLMLRSRIMWEQAKNTW